MRYATTYQRHASPARRHFTTIKVSIAQEHRLYNIMDPYRDIILRILLGRCLDAGRRGSAIRCAWVTPWTHHPTAKTRDWCREATRRSSCLSPFWRGGNNLWWKVGYLDAFSFIVVRSWDDLHMLVNRAWQKRSECCAYFNDLVSREREKGDVGCVASHEVTIQYSQY